MILGLNCLSLLFTTTYEIQGLLLGQTPRAEIVLESLKHAHASFGSKLNKTLAKDLKEEVNHFIEEITQEISVLMSKRSGLAINELKNLTLDSAKNLAREKANIEIDHYVNNLKYNVYKGKEKSTESASSKISTAQTDEKKAKYGEGAYGQGVYGGGKVEGGEIEDAGTMSDGGSGVAGASIGGFSVSDQPAEIDALGFDHYTTAIASFLGHKDTKAPLTMSIEGEWGSGKTSFMIQLEEKLRAQGGLSVRFSPWRHDKEDAVWAAFVMAFIDQLSDPGWLRGLLQNMKLLRYRFDWRAGWLEVVRIVAKLYVYFLVLVFMIIFLWVTSIQYISDLGFGGKLILSIVGAVATVGAVVLKGLKKAREVVGNPFEHDLKKYIQAPDYAGRISFVERFHKDFKEIVKTYAGDKKVYVFIDDLDRCEVPKAAELMKAINLMITDELNLIFIIGMDRQKVAAGLAVKDKELIRYLRPEMIGQKSDEDKISYWLAGLRYGYSFIEKFIQLPFGIPKPTLSDIDNMMASIRREEGEEELVPSSESKAIKEDSSREDIGRDGKKPVGSREEQEAKREEQRKVVEKKQLELKFANDSKQIGEIVHMVCSSLDFNPRRVKQFINLFRLRAYIAYETQLLILPEDVEVTDGVTLEQLGKIVAISLRWPLLLEALERDESLLWNLSEFAERKKDVISSLENVVIRRWARDEQLMKLISSGCVTEEGKQTDEWSKYTLKHANIDKLLQVSPKIRSMKEVPLEACVSNVSGVSGVMSMEGKMSRIQLSAERTERIDSMQEYENLKALVAEIEFDINNTEGGNKAAGTRVRKQMQKVKQAAQLVRNRILEIRYPE